MANVDFIQKRIDGKEKELAKLQKKLERIEKAEATNWEVNPYYYYADDKKWCLKDIENCKKALENYRNQLNKEIEKANSRNVKPILDFLENWKNNVFNFYHRGLVEAFKDYAEYQKAVDDFNKVYDDCQKKIKEIEKTVADKYEKLEKIHKIYKIEDEAEAKSNKNELWEAWRINLNGRFETVVVNPTAKYRWEREKKVKVENGKYEPYKAYIVGYKTIEEAEAKLHKDLENDANAMYDDIINRTNRIVGEITDASYLRIGAKGELNGYIVGTRGKAKVQTIDAGGYNEDVILESGRHGQCYHFRTLIHEMK